MKRLMILTVTFVVASAQAGWGDLGKAAAKEATAATVKGLVGTLKEDAKQSTPQQEQKSSRDDVMSERATKEEIGKRQAAEKEQREAEMAKVPGFTGKKFDWKYGDTEHHTRIVSGDNIERACDGAYQIQNFHNDNYGFSWVGFKSLEDLEYAIAQVDAYVTKCVGWQKIAIDNLVDGMRKEDDKTKFAIDKDGNRVEWFIFCTRKDDQGKIYGCFDVRWTDKYDDYMKGFNHLENDGSVEFWQKLVEACKKAVELYKSGLQESMAKAQKIKEAANLFN